jgi:hypothetical protein
MKMKMMVEKYVQTQLVVNTSLENPVYQVPKMAV